MKWNNRKAEDARLHYSQNGSVMLWSLMVLTLLLTLSVTSMTMGAAALTKAKKEAYESQAYYTSKGAVDLAADALFGEPPIEAAHELMLYVEEAAGRGEDYESCGEDPEAWDLVEGLPDGLGECRMRLCYRAAADALYISACTSIGSSQRIVTLELEREILDQAAEEDQPGGADDSKSPVWRPRRYMGADKNGNNTRR